MSGLLTITVNTPLSILTVGLVTSVETPQQVMERLLKEFFKRQ